MSAEDIALLEPHMQRCSLHLRMNLESARVPIDFVYFLEEGIGSVVATGRHGHETEVGFIGFEGMTGSSIVMGDVRNVHQCYVQLAGEAIRIGVTAFSSALASSPTMRMFLLRYALSLQIQTACTALVNARSKLEERLARWLLMCDDRVSHGRLTITHEFLGIMLVVRRPGVTVALQELEGRGLIRATRGQIVLLDREGLIALANGGCGEAEAEYERLIGKPREN